MSLLQLSCEGWLGSLQLKAGSVELTASAAVRRCPVTVMFW